MVIPFLISRRRVRDCLLCVMPVRVQCEIENKYIWWISAVYNVTYVPWCIQQTYENLTVRERTLGDDSSARSLIRFPTITFSTQLFPLPAFTMSMLYIHNIYVSYLQA